MYTEAQEAELVAAGSIDNAKALEFAEKFDKDVRSVRAKAVSLGIYKAKEKAASKRGESKEALVAKIADLVGSGAALQSLEKASKDDLLALVAKLAA